MVDFSFKERFFLPKYDSYEEICPGRVSVDTDRCTGCAFCLRVCPAKALYIKDKKTAMIEINNMCVFCGDCAAICPEQAIRMKTPFKYAKYYKTIHTKDPALPRLFDK